MIIFRYEASPIDIGENAFFDVTFEYNQNWEGTTENPIPSPTFPTANVDSQFSFAQGWPLITSTLIVSPTFDNQIFFEEFDIYNGGWPEF